jgi:phosphoglycolate phosphatase-like HAD superfamily hydrolase
VREILEDLGHRPSVVSLLLTGNTEAGGRAKLRYYGLDEYFAVGAFADGTTDRVAIARKGLTLAAQTLGSALEPGRAFVVGDTPHDIRCARAIGVRAVAVATGTYTTAQLGEHEPWWVIDQLPSSEEFAERLGFGSAREAVPGVRPADVPGVPAAVQPEAVAARAHRNAGAGRGGGVVGAPGAPSAAEPVPRTP